MTLKLHFNEFQRYIVTTSLSIESKVERLQHPHLSFTHSSVSNPKNKRNAILFVASRHVAIVLCPQELESHL